ncbi:MAG: PAS domain S-box protein, partial [Rectinemataceae bacterium]|nr:PAS domain S-box protein [Rectinemataceae bacterium]
MSSQNTYARFFDMAAVGCLVLDKGLRILEANAAFSQLSGWSGPDASDSFMPEYLADEDRESFCSFADSLVVPGDTKECCLMLASGGKKTWVHIRGEAGSGDCENRILLTVVAFPEKTGAEWELRCSESLLRSTIVSMGEGMIAADRELRITHMNPQAEILTGWKESDALGLRLGEVYVLRNAISGSTPETLASRSIAEGSVLKDDGSPELVHRNGTSVAVSDTITPIRSPGASPDGVVILFQDVSQEITTISRISEARGLFRTIFHFIPLPTALIRISDMRFVDTNQAFELELGYKTDALRGRSVFEFDLWDDGTMPDKIVRLMEETGHIYSLQAQHKRADGSIRDVLLYIEAVMIESETYALETFVDITDLRAAETELENERLRLRTILETIPDMIWMKSTDGIYLACNPRFELFFGGKEEDIVGKTDFDFVPRELAEFFRAKDLAAIAKGKPSVNTEWVTFASDGHSELLETIKTPTYDSNGKLVGVLGIARDITERKRAEDLISKLNQNLEKRVEERTSELLAANGDLEAFAYSVSHDLRTPLRSINGFAHIIREKYGALLDDEGRRIAGVISENAAKMGRLIDDLLAFSRLGRTEMRLVSVDMEALAREVFDELTLDSAVKPKLRLAALPPSEGDPSMLRQVWINLLSNAIKF